MAKLEQTVYGDFNQILNKIQTGILNGSMSASLEESSDFLLSFYHAAKIRLYRRIKQ